MSATLLLLLILIVGYGGTHMHITNAQDAFSPTESWGASSTSTSTSTSGSAYPDTTTSSSAASASASASASTGSWFPWFPTSIPSSTSTSTSTPTATPYPYPYPTAAPYPYPSYPTTAPTSSSSISGDEPDRGTYWPWDTPRGILPTVTPAAAGAPSLNPASDPSSYYVVWAISTNDSAIANTTSTIPSGLLYQSLTMRRTGDAIYFCARYATRMEARARDVDVDSILSTYNRAYYSNGVLEQSLGVGIDSAGLSRVLLQFSYLDRSNRIPGTGSNAAWAYSTHYIAARSRTGEFRMLKLPAYTYSYQDAVEMYHACVNERGIDGTAYWETVKMVAEGEVQLQTTGSRGSTLEHMGAFQWLEVPRFRSASFSDYYLLVSWQSLSGVRLSRFHHYLWYQSSAAFSAYSWNEWYLQNYNSYPASPTSYNQLDYSTNSKPVIAVYRNGAALQSSYTYYNDFYQLTRDFYWCMYGAQTTSPPYQPYPYPTPYPQPSYPYNPYQDFTFTRKWSDLAVKDRTFIIAYPIAIITTAIIIILITTCCIKCRDRRTTSGAAAAAGGAPLITSTASTSTSTSTSASASASASATSLSTRFHNLSSVGMLLSLLSLLLLVIALAVDRFSFASVDWRTWASYGPFSSNQTSPWRGWLNMYWTGQVFGPITAAVIITNIILEITNFILITSIKRSHDFTTRAASHPAILTCACFIVSLTAVFIWLPIHIRLLDPALGRMVIENVHNSGMYYYNPTWRVQMGVSAILLIVATGIQLLAIIPMARLRYLAQQSQSQSQVPSGLLSVATVDYTRGDQQSISTSTSTATRAQQAEDDALQLVQIGSQYYYRAEPPSMTTPYVYGSGLPASGPVSYSYYAPPVASAPPATVAASASAASASTYYPGYIPPSFQALAHPITIAVPLPSTPAPAPASASAPSPAPSPSVYPALPVEVPESGPNTRYQRLL